MSQHTVHVAVQDGDEDWVREHQKRVRFLTNLVEEMFVDQKATLLSPVFREMIVRHARGVRDDLDRIGGRPVYVDNLGKPLSSNS